MDEWFEGPMDPFEAALEREAAAEEWDGEDPGDYWHEDPEELFPDDHEEDILDHELAPEEWEGDDDLMDF